MTTCNDADDNNEVKNHDDDDSNDGDDFFLVGFNFTYFRIVGQTKSVILLAIYSQTVQDFQVG